MDKLAYAAVEKIKDKWEDKLYAGEQVSHYAKGNILGQLGGSHSFHIPGTSDAVRLSDCKGNKKALLIGINYFGTKFQLKGCINDVQNINKFIQQQYNFKPSNIVVLTDDQKDARFIPNRQNITNAIKWLIAGAQPGDSLFFHYSGHGGQAEDKDGDESDGMDETIMPVDFETKGEILDDELHQLMVKPLPEGARLTAVFDCCHSGTVLDVPYVYRCDGRIQLVTDHNHQAGAIALLNAFLDHHKGHKAAAMDNLKEGLQLLVKPKKMAVAEAERHQKKMETHQSLADVIQFAGCKDSQTSADTTVNSQATGAMSYALIQVLTKNPNITYKDMLFEMRSILKGRYTQIPQLCTGRPMDLSQEFIM